MISRIGMRARLLVGAMMLTVPTAAFASDVVGTVSDATGTRTLQGAQLTIVELGRTAQADSDGQYRFVDVPGGTYTLRAEFPGVDSFEVQIVVPADGTLTQDVVLGGDDAEILVVGQRANLFNALARQKSADGVSSVVTRDSVGQFPDQNVAESLRRLPGINVLNDQGEGRFVSVRGLSPDLNSSSINGVRLPAPESDVRSVALDVISSGQIESIEVKKSLTPDMDGDTIGASIEIHTTSAFDRKKNLLSASVEGSYAFKRGDLTPKADLDFSYKVSDDFGVSGGFSYYKRKFSTDNIETGGWKLADDDTTAYAEEVEYRDYDVDRKRINGSLSFDWRASDTTKIYLRGLYSQFDDQEFRNRLAFVFDGDPSASKGDTVTFVDSADRIEVRRDLKDRFETQKIRSITLGGETNTGEWKFDYAGAWAKSSEYENGSLDPTRFRARFDDDGVSVIYDYSNENRPAYSIPLGNAEFLDTSNYTFNRVERTALSDSVDEEYSLRANLARTFGFDNGEFTVQAGAKARWRTKSYDFNLEYYDGYNGSFTLDDVLGTQSYDFADIGPVMSKYGTRDFFYNNRANFELDPVESGMGSVLDDYSVDEDIVAGYLLGRWDSPFVRVIGGVRVEHTKNRSNGNLVDEGLSCGDDYCVTPVTYDRSYTDWLPSVNVRLAPTQGLVLRGAVYRSLVRPNLKDMAPRFTINEDLEAELGNPYLRPYKAWNFDASVEYYFAKDGAISANFFHKSVSDYIYTFNSKVDGTFNGIDYEEITTPTNGDTAKITGAEFSYNQVLSFLPGPFDGLLVNFNYTFTDAKGDVNDGREISLPSSSRNTFNAVLGYEKGPVSIRVSGTYRDKYLDEVGDDADEDRWVRDHFQLDISAKFWVMKDVQLFFDVINLNNASYYAYQNFEGRRRLLQYEEYEATVKGGVKVKF